MATYGFDDKNSKQIATGLPRQSARKTAQRIANERGESVWLYRDSEGAQAFESEEIKPISRARDMSEVWTMGEWATKMAGVR